MMTCRQVSPLKLLFLVICLWPSLSTSSEVRGRPYSGGRQTYYADPLSEKPLDQLALSISPQSTQVQGGPVHTWNGCDEFAAIQGGYVGENAGSKKGSQRAADGQKCGHDQINKDFARQIDAVLLTCINTAYSTIDNSGRTIDKVFIQHMGVYNYRVKNTMSGNSTSLSEHAFGRAMDIAAFDLYAGGMKVDTMKMVKGTDGRTSTFYDSFRDCWKDKLALHGFCKAPSQGSIGHTGSHEPCNQKHDDHLHLECQAP